MNFRRLHWALFLLGGALTNAAVIAAIAGFNRIGTVPDQAGDFFDSVVFAQVIIIVATIFPYRYAVGGTPVASDGLQILQLLWQHRDPRAEVEPKAAYADLLSGYSRGEDSPPAMSRASARILYQVYRADRWTDKEARRDFQKSLLREVEHEQLSHEEQMLVLDALVTDGLISGDRALRSRLDEWSLQALAHGPQLSSLLCTRGAVLIELGHYEEGKALLTSLATAGQLKPFDSFMNQIFLARAEHALGNIETARELAKAARTAAEADPGAPPVVALLARLPPET